MIPKRLLTFSLIDSGKTDTKGLWDTADMTFGIATQPDQSFPRTEHGTKPIYILNADVDRREPARPCELCQPSGVSGIRFIFPR